MQYRDSMTAIRHHVTGPAMFFPVPGQHIRASAVRSQVESNRTADRP